VIGVRLLDRHGWLQSIQEFQPSNGMAGECPDADVTALSFPWPSGSSIYPTIRRSLDLGSGNEFTRSLIQTQSIGNEQSVAGDASQTMPRHLLFGAVDEIAAPFPGQWAIPMDIQRVPALQETIKHSRTSRMDGKGGRFDYTPKSYVAFGLPKEATAPNQPGRTFPIDHLHLRTTRVRSDSQEWASAM